MNDEERDRLMRESAQAREVLASDAFTRTVEAMHRGFYSKWRDPATPAETREECRKFSILLDKLVEELTDQMERGITQAKLDQVKLDQEAATKRPNGVGASRRT